MYFDHNDRRRRAVWRIIKSNASDQAKADAFGALAVWQPRAGVAKRFASGPRPYRRPANLPRWWRREGARS